MQWIAGYQETLGEFGVEEGDVLFPSHPQAGMGLLIDKYVERTVVTLSSWLVNIVEVRPGSFAWGRREAILTAVFLRLIKYVAGSAGR
jgi:hypothetical protein